MYIYTYIYIYIYIHIYIWAFLFLQWPQSIGGFTVCPCTFCIGITSTNSQLYMFLHGNENLLSLENKHGQRFCITFGTMIYARPPTQLSMKRMYV